MSRALTRGDVEQRHPGILDEIADINLTLAAIGRRHGLTRERVRQIALSQGIVRERSWPPALIAALGTEPDIYLARRFGVSRNRIRRLRKSRGIAVFDSTQRGEAFAAMLGTMSDSEVSQRTGVPASTVGAARARAGIPPFIALHGRRFDYDEIRRLHASGESQQSIADKIGCSKGTVYKALRGES